MIAKHFSMIEDKDKVKKEIFDEDGDNERFDLCYFDINWLTNKSETSQEFLTKL